MVARSRRRSKGRPRGKGESISRKPKQSRDPQRPNGADLAELRHVSIRDLPLSKIRPSPENEQLYRPVSRDDPDVLELANSIRQHGLREQIVVTNDYYILSGHRRYVACQLAGLTTVPCRIEDISRPDPEFMVLLREFNRQRIKTLDEVAREEVVSANPEEAHRLLLEHRRQTAAVCADAIKIDGRKHRATISNAKVPFLNAIIDVLNRLREYWPLTDRVIHYNLLNDPPLIHASKAQSIYTNTEKAYKSACELITRARLDGSIPFAAIHDPTRPVTTWRVDQTAQSFIRRDLNQFLKGYYRDLQQSQINHIEIVGEKNTIDGTVKPIAMEYCIPLTIGRGYCSLPPRYEMAERFRKSGREALIILILSDFDPEGEDIAHSFARSMRDDFGVDQVKAIKVGLNRAQIDEMQLPTKMKAKESSSRYAKFIEQHGEDVYELEAVPPDRLQAILRYAIDSVLDVDAFNAEIDAEKQDAAFLDGLRRTVLAQIGPALKGEN